MNVQFKALDYTKDDDFEEAEYEFHGDKDTGWEIKRNGKLYLQLGKGYEVLKTKYCGVCSTDLDRRFLPFPLPQVTGHEVVTESLDGKEKFVVEINDTGIARGDLDLDSFCIAGIPTHSPTRMVLGIDRLPGGFGKYILAPKNAIVPFSKISSEEAVLIEPFAAALQAVTSSPPRSGDSVAVLGPRRLGGLLLLALQAYRKSSKIDFSISAIVRHDHLVDLDKNIGEDEIVDLRKIHPEVIREKFDIVYDTTSTPSGFEFAIQLAKREVHLKSTNGQEVLGLKKLTEMVVDEISILPYSIENLKFKWENEKKENSKIYISPNVKIDSLPQGYTEYRLSFEEAVKVLHSPEFSGRLPRFDLAIASNTDEIDKILRPSKEDENSILRPRGAILFQGEPKDNSLLKFLSYGKSLRSSRCGDFHLSVKLLEENPDIAKKLSKTMITHKFSPRELKKAFLVARDPSSVKVVIRHD
ncbi:MAG: alcohol dehydrogenase catalytic domain-containing protein [Leptospiraceae bacterium]|nr:alcohol dehydrogenase catalytic domain-containing protein [Leptospiraceae bacterium]